MLARHNTHVVTAGTEEALAGVSMFFRSERNYEVQSNLQSLGASECVMVYGNNVRAGWRGSKSFILVHKTDAPEQKKSLLCWVCTTLHRIISHHPTLH